MRQTPVYEYESNEVYSARLCAHTNEQIALGFNVFEQLICPVYRNLTKLKTSNLLGASKKKRKEKKQNTAS